METVDVLHRVEEKLDVLIRLLAQQTVRSEESLKDKVLVLRRTGMMPGEIATVLGTTRKSVSVRLAEAKRSKSRRTRH